MEGRTIRGRSGIQKQLACAMTMHLVWGEIPYYQPRVGTGRYMAPDSFMVRSGNVPACVNHWRDNDKILSCQATWGATSSGLVISHVLDDAIDYERGILEAVQRQQLYWSYGDGAHPDATRLAIAAHGGKTIAHAVAQLERVSFGHVAYVAIPAFPQEPIRWIGL